MPRSDRKRLSYNSRCFKEAPCAATSLHSATKFDRSESFVRRPLCVSRPSRMVTFRPDVPTYDIVVASFSTEVASKIVTSLSAGPFSSRTGMVFSSTYAWRWSCTCSCSSVTCACEWEWTSPPSPWECSCTCVCAPVAFLLSSSAACAWSWCTWSCSCCSGITVASSSSCSWSAWCVSSLMVLQPWASLWLLPLLRYARCSFQPRIRGCLAAMRCCESMHCWCVPWLGSIRWRRLQHQASVL